jgi:hypothetical protein
MDHTVFLVLEKDTQSLLFLLTSLKEFYAKKSYHSALDYVNGSIIASNNSLRIIDRQLFELKAAS